MSDAKELKRTYTIPLRRGFANTPRYRRTNKAVRVLKKYVIKHMKSEKIKIGPHLNELLWVNGIKNPPGKVHVNATKDTEGVVRVELVGTEYVDFKQQEKVVAPKGIQEKIKKTVEEAKAGSKSEKTTETTKPEVKATEKKATEKKPVVQKAKTPVKKEAPAKVEKPVAVNKATPETPTKAE